MCAVLAGQVEWLQSQGEGASASNFSCDSWQHRLRLASSQAADLLGAEELHLFPNVAIAADGARHLQQKRWPQPRRVRHVKLSQPLIFCKACPHFGQALVCRLHADRSGLLAADQQAASSALNLMSWRLAASEVRAASTQASTRHTSGPHAWPSCGVCTSAGTRRQLSQCQHALRQCAPLTLVPQALQVITGWLAGSATSWPAPQPGPLQCRYLGSRWESFLRQTSSSAGSATRSRSCSVRSEVQVGAKMHGSAPCSEGGSCLQTRPCNLQPGAAAEAGCAPKPCRPRSRARCGFARTGCTHPPRARTRARPAQTHPAPCFHSRSRRTVLTPLLSWVRCWAAAFRADAAPGPSCD